VLREYTVLLDPPILRRRPGAPACRTSHRKTSRGTATVGAPKRRHASGGPEPAAGRRPRNRRSSPPTPAPHRRRNRQRNDRPNDYGRCPRRDPSEIARATSDEKTNINQMMLALLGQSQGVLQTTSTRSSAARSRIPNSDDIRNRRDPRAVAQVQSE
jgi:hypothetical protein